MSYPMVALGELCEMSSGGTPLRSVGKYYDGGSIPWVKIGDIENADEGVINRTEEFITEEGLAAINDRSFAKGTVLFAMYGSVGKVAVAGMPLATNQAILGIRPDQSKLSTDYLVHWLRSRQHEWEHQARGVALKNLSAGIVKQQMIPLPPLPEQRRIAAILDKAQALVANDKRTLAVYDQLAKSLFLELFGDPVRNERGWEVKAVADVGTSRLGKMLDAKKQTGQHLRKYLRNTNVQWRDIQVHDLHEMDFDENDRSEFRLELGDILMCEGGEVGRCAIWEAPLEECYFQKALHRIRLDKSQIQPEYFVQLFIELVERDGLKDYTSTSTISHLTGEKLATVRIPVPPIKLQTLFEERLKGVRTQRAKSVQSLRQSEALFGSLLQVAFAGDLG